MSQARHRARQVVLVVHLAAAAGGVAGLSWLARPSTAGMAASGHDERALPPGVVSQPWAVTVVGADRTSAAGLRRRCDEVAALVGAPSVPGSVPAPALQAGGQRGPSTPAPVHVVARARDPSSTVEARALVREVEWLPSVDALPPLLVALEACRDPAARALLIQAERRARLRASPLELASAPAPDLGAIAAARAPEALVEQLALLDDPRRPLAVRAAASAALRSVGDPSVSAALERTLRDGDAVGRRLAAEALAERALHPDSESALERALLDADPSVRAASARALAAQGRGAPVIARALACESDERTVVALVEALGLLVAVEHAPTLESLARTGATSVREAATRALVRLRSGERAP